MLPRQVQEFVLVLPAQRFLLEDLGLGRRRWRLCHFCDEIRSRRFRQAVDQDADKGNLHESEETKAKAKKNAGTILEPHPFFFPRITDAGEVRFKLCSLSNDQNGDMRWTDTHQFSH